MSLLALIALSFLPGAEEGAPGTLELVESWPVETSLDNADIPDTAEVWLKLIAGASRSIELGHFYASNRPGSRLEEVIVAIQQAAARGVSVRFLASARFYETYPETLDRLHASDGIEVRHYDMEPLSGGVLHAKFLLVDGATATVGSANFDWRSLAHIQELGVVFSHPKLTGALADVFELDWALAGGAPRSAVAAPKLRADEFPVALAFGSDSVQVTPVFSPQGLLPAPELWDLPHLKRWIDEATQTVRIQLLTYRAVGYDKTYFDELESALRRAAARGVEVQLLLSHWSKRGGTIEGLQSLQALRHVEVRLLTVPEWSEGFIPFGRVAHSKYMAIDGQRAWLGTSNWERGYFYESRNAGVLIEGSAFAKRVERYFVNAWESTYSEVVDPAHSYPAPRVAK